MPNPDVICVATDQLEACNCGAEALASQPQELQRIVGTLQTDKRRRLRAWIGKEPQRSGGDDPESPFSADEQALHIVAGVVLAQLAQGVDDAAIGEHRLDAGDKVARVAVGDDVQAASVGRDVAANGAGAFRRQRQRKQAIGGERCRLRFAECNAGFANHQVAVHVNLADRAQALGRNDNFLAAQVGRLAADEAGVASLWNHADPRLVAESRDLRDFLGRTRPHQRKRHSLIKFAWLDERAGEQRGVGQHVPRAHNILQGGDNGFSFRRVHLEEPPHAGFRFWPAKDGGDFDMGRKAKLVKRGHRLNLKAAFDENARIAGEGRCVA